MKEHKQLLLNIPEILQFGDCHRTALACLLDFDSPDDAPHIIGEWETREAIRRAGPGHPYWERHDFDPQYDWSWDARQEHWLNGIGYTLASFNYNGDMPSTQLHQYMKQVNPGVLYLLSGESPRGTNHTVICGGWEGGWRWDPHPHGGYLVGPLDNGMWEIGILLPIAMKEKT